MMRAIIPQKKSRSGKLDLENKDRRKIILSDRVIVEIVFGRACKLFGILLGKYHWDREHYNNISDVCFSFLNYILCCTREKCQL